MVNALLLFLMFQLLTAFLPLPARAGETPVSRQDISIVLEPQAHRLTGESTFRFAPGVRMVKLELAAEAKVESVSVAGRPVPFSFSGGNLAFNLPEGTGETPATVSYRASFNDAVASNPGAGEDPSYGVNAAISTDGIFLGEGALWYPVPPGVPAHRSLSIAAPAGIEGVSFGKRVLRETSGGVSRSRWEEAHPVGALSVAAGRYRVEERTLGGIAIYSYLSEENASLAPRYLDAAARYIKFYSDLFGPYPFEKFAVVENFFPTGYGFPSFTLLGGSVIRLPFIVDTSFPHEIAHSWWGNGIGVERREGNWCEGLVTYLADYYLKELRSEAEGREYRRQLLNDFSSLVSPRNDFPLNRFESRNDPASRAIGYGKAAMLFHMVRREVGDAAFFGALREVVRERMYRQASWSDFERAFSRASGRDLAPFMKQWIFKTGGPRLKLAEVGTHREAKGWSVSGVVLEDPDFRLKVPLRLERAGKPAQTLLPVAAGGTPFRIESPEKPRRLLLDPDSEVFRVLAPDEIPATVNSVKGATALTGVVTARCRASESTFRDFLASLSQGRAPLVSEEELKRRPAAGDLVFCGLPVDRSLFPALPEGVETDSGGFLVEGTSYAAPDALLVLVRKFPGSSGRFGALFEPLSEAAARQYAPKVTHYGKYGCLVFAGGANRHKGTLPAGEGDAVVNLGER